LRSLIFNTKEIHFIVGPESDRPEGIAPIRSEDDFVKHQDVAVAFLCVEEGDTEKDAFIIVTELLGYAKRLGRKILLVPFVHLTSTPAPKEISVPLIELISDKLRANDALSGTGGFGFRKALIARWVTLLRGPRKGGVGGEVAYRDSRYSTARQSRRENN
jgi:hypothetical protein